MTWIIFFKIFLLIFIGYIYDKAYTIYLSEIYENRKIKKKISIEIDTSETLNQRGPYNFIRGIKDILPYNTRNCNFISSKNIYPNKRKKKSNFYFIPFPQFNEHIYNRWIKIKKVHKLILGPIFVPDFWGRFPDKNIWKERRFSEILMQVRGIAVHSERVRNYLSKKTNTINFIKQFKIIRPCTNLNPKNINPFTKRKIDILFFEKYQDLDFSQQGTQIFNLFSNTSKKIEKIKYGNYSKENMEHLANNSKFIIYFSFFDTGAIGLKEIQNYGVFAFSHQRDLIIHKDTGFYVPELANKKDMSQAYKIILEKIENITNLQPNTQLIAKINQEINKCQNALNDLCKNI